ncbi:MAG: response regulator, partial [Lachnospiraceae bacterium]|nr:response regulator [Lachnospiraceae bacterium]
MSRKVLIVEDDKEINNILQTFLEQKGYEVWTAFDGHAATGQIQEREYDLILMDLMLPFKSGERLIK